MARFLLKAGAERYTRKDAGRYIYLQDADGPVEVEINSVRHLLRRGKGLNVPEGFFQVTYSNLHGADQWVTFDIGPHIFIDNELSGSIDVNSLPVGQAPGSPLLVAQVGTPINRVRKFSVSHNLASVSAGNYMGICARLGATFAGAAIKITGVRVSGKIDGDAERVSIKTVGVTDAVLTADAYWADATVVSHQVGTAIPAGDLKVVNSTSAAGEAGGSLFTESFFSFVNLYSERVMPVDISLGAVEYLQVGLHNAAGGRRMALTLEGEIHD